MSSKRLPGKVLKSLAGKPMLQWVIDAAKDSKLADAVVVATSTDKADNAIARYMKKDYFRGSLDDVLDRYYQLCGILHADVIVRLTGDCPMLTGEIIDRVIKVYLLSDDFDYVRNAVDGYDVEVFGYGCLMEAAKLAGEDEREHVTTYFQHNPERFGWLDTFIPDDIVGHWSVDTPEDFSKIEGVLKCRGDILRPLGLMTRT